jgi:cellulose biosynthesis protein BcsQ
MAFKIILFNHKGGVSKTTTTYNLGWKLADQGKRTLIIDADPQCNLTNLILRDGFDDYYTNPETKYHNIKDGVKSAFEGKPYPIEAVNCACPSENPNLFLMAGHGNLSEYDASLSFAQNSNNAITALMNLPGAFNELINKTCEKYDIDIVLIDLNPGLSAINQNLFILSDAFIVPTNPDPFSAMAIVSLAKILPRWVDWADKMRPSYADASYPLPNSQPKFVGTIIQRFNVRNKKASASTQLPIDGIKTAVQDILIPALKRQNMLFEQYDEQVVENKYCLAEIPDFQGLVNKSYDIGKPVFALTEEDIKEKSSGNIATTYKQSTDRFNEIFDILASQITKITDYASSPEPVY